MQDQPLDLIGTPAFVPGRQRSQLTVSDRHGHHRRVVLETAHLIEAPNWSPDGQWLLFNSEGALFKVRADGSTAPERIDSGTHATANNDHVLSPDGRTVYFSTNDGRLLAVPFEGGVPRRVSSEALVETGFHYYLHGVSPDDGLLAYVGLRMAAGGVSGTSTASTPCPRKGEKTGPCCCQGCRSMALSIRPMARGSTSTARSARAHPDTHNSSACARTARASSN